MKRGPKPKPGPRDRSGRLLRRGGRCLDCGRAISRPIGRCTPCYAAHRIAQRPPRICSGCGVTFSPRPSSRRAAQAFCSLSCHHAWQRRQPQPTRRPAFACQHCAVAVQRKGHSGGDLKLYCSRRCSARDRCAREAGRLDAARAATRQTLARPCRRCGEPLGTTQRSAQFHHHCRQAHRAERADRQARFERAVRARAHVAVRHVCPCCGESFTPVYGDRRRVFCSARCCKLMRKARISGLGKIPIDERNVLAQMLADCKRARRRLNGATRGAA